MNKENCTDGKCCNCELCKEKDIKQRIKDAWWDVELFRLTEGRLPGDNDRLTKKTAKKFIDMCHVGKIAKEDIEACLQFAFHVYASANLAYEKE